MKTVFKYPVPKVLQKFQLALPVGFKFLRIGFQNEELFIWAEVRKDVATAICSFAAYGTGHDIPDGAAYIATYDLGPYVIHLYQL